MRAYLIGLAAVLFPCFLLYPDGRGFAVDWFNHVWMVGYVGEYLRQHGSFPAVANTPEASGMAFPVFYGYLFYPLLGLAATHLHPEIVVRAAAVLMIAVQYACVHKTVRRLNGSEGLAAGLACATVWSTYALTNLYNRGALTEFFAIGVLTCAVCTWFDMLRAESRATVWRRGLRFGLFVTLAVGFHPITGLCSLPLFAVLLLALPARRARLGPVLAVCSVAVVGAGLVLGSWLYAVHRYGQQIGVNSGVTLAETSANPIISPLDRWQTRLNPLPSDMRCDAAAPRNVSTPYLDSQVALPLLLLGAGTAGVVLRAGRGSRVAAAAFLAVPALYAAVMLVLSITARPFAYLPDTCNNIQFLYRIVSFVNLGFLLVPLFALLWAARAGRPTVTVSPVLLCFVLTYAGFCVVLKLQHAETARIPPEAFIETWAVRGRVFDPHPKHDRWVKNTVDRDALTALPLTSYGHVGYGTPKYLPQLGPEDAPNTTRATFGIESKGGYFGDPHPLTVTLDRPGYVETNVIVFPWNRFEVDGRPVAVEDLRAWGGPSAHTAIPVPAGTHTIQYRFVTERAWRRLHRVSQVSLLVWVGALGVLGAVRMVRARRARDASPAAAPEPVTIETGATPVAC